MPALQGVGRGLDQNGAVSLKFIYVVSARPSGLAFETGPYSDHGPGDALNGKLLSAL